MELTRDDGLDHIIAMQQSLAFYEAILSHDHPAFIGILRLALLRAKAGTDRALVGLYIVGLIVLPANILVGSSPPSLPQINADFPPRSLLTQRRRTP
jgi:Mg2+ and Co2+ transporter CorA